MAGDIESTPVACRLPDHALLNYTQDEPPLPPPPSPLRSPPIRCSPLHPIHSSASSSSFCVFYCFSHFTPVRLSFFCYPHSVAASLLPPLPPPSFSTSSPPCTQPHLGLLFPFSSVLSELLTLCPLLRPKSTFLDGWTYISQTDGSTQSDTLADTLTPYPP